MAKNKATIARVKRRFVIEANKTEGIYNYDKDNAYPQRTELIVGASGIGTSCVRLYAKYLQGQGFLDKTFYKLVSNEVTGLTIDKLHRKNCEDLALRGGWAVHVNWNANYKISSINIIEFGDLRIALPDKSGKSTKIYEYDDWYLQKRDRMEKARINIYDKFSPDPEKIKEQVLAAGGWDFWKGQVYYWSPKGLAYPAPIFASVIEDILTDASLKTFRLNNVDTNFLANSIFVHKGEFEDDKERREFVESLEEFQGAENAGKMMLVEIEDEEQKPEIISVEAPKNDKVFELTANSAKDSIIEAFGQPPILLGKFVGGSFTQQQWEDAKVFYDEYTAADRLCFSEEYKYLFQFWDGVACPSDDWTIIPLTGLKDNEEEISLVDSLDSHVIININAKLAEPITISTPDQKIAYFVVVFGLTDEQARYLVTGTKAALPPPTPPNPYPAT